MLNRMKLKTFGGLEDATTLIWRSSFQQWKALCILKSQKA